MRTLEEYISESYVAIDDIINNADSINEGSDIKFGEIFGFRASMGHGKASYVSTKVGKNVDMSYISTELRNNLISKSYADVKEVMLATWLDNLSFEQYKKYVPSKFVGIEFLGTEAKEMANYILESAKRDGVIKNIDSIKLTIYFPKDTSDILRLVFVKNGNGAKTVDFYYDVK